MVKSTIEKENAIDFGITTFRAHLYGTHFKVTSDYKPLRYLFNLKNPTSKLNRIRLDLKEYNITVEYIKGRDNVAADALSRINVNDLVYPWWRHKTNNEFKPDQKQIMYPKVNENNEKNNNGTKFLQVIFEHIIYEFPN